MSTLYFVISESPVYLQKKRQSKNRLEMKESPKLMLSLKTESAKGVCKYKYHNMYPGIFGYIGMIVVLA